MIPDRFAVVSKDANRDLVEEGRRSRIETGLQETWHERAVAKNLVEERE
jgi:hypothetical protein